MGAGRRDRTIEVWTSRRRGTAAWEERGQRTHAEQNEKVHLEEGERRAVEVHRLRDDVVRTGFFARSSNLPSEEWEAHPPAPGHPNGRCAQPGDDNWHVWMDGAGVDDEPACRDEDEVRGEALYGRHLTPNAERRMGPSEIL